MGYGNEIDDLIDKLLNESNRNYRVPYSYGSDEVIPTSEMHMLANICNYPYFNVSQLADFMGITKSMVSKTTANLHKKGLIEKLHKKDNDKEVYFIATEKGLKANKGHKAFHEQWDHNKWTHFDTLPEEEKQVIKDFLVNYIEYMHQMGIGKAGSA